MLEQHPINSHQQKQIHIKINDDILEGRYANVVHIQHTKEEFVLDFFMVAVPAGILASRVIMSPGHLKRTIRALEDNIKKYEEKFGKIEEAEEKKEVGFKI